jgi:hypothetical protein
MSTPSTAPHPAAPLPGNQEAATISNLDRYKKDLDSLIDKGNLLHNAMQAEQFPKQVESQVESLVKKDLAKKRLDKNTLRIKTQQVLKALPSFTATYQSWYSEAKALVRQILPDRLSDFVSHYEKPKHRKDITFENYKIEDYLQGLNMTRGGWEKTKIVGPDAAIPQFRQQLAILESARARFQSSLFDIRQLVQADLFDSELDVAEELAKKKFTRAAGAVAGVVLERHLAQVCDNHAIKVAKKAPNISDLNDAIKNANVLDVPQWRFIQHLADIRNLCDHNRTTEPTPEQVNDLVAGFRRLTKTLF